MKQHSLSKVKYGLLRPSKIQWNEEKRRNQQYRGRQALHIPGTWDEHTLHLNVPQCCPFGNHCKFNK